jgi:hypothetical protein
MITVSDPKAVAAPDRKRSRYELIFIVIVIAVAAASWSTRLIGPIDLRYDASTYFILGTSLAEGKGYRLLNEPGEIEATQYPPLLPLIVAAHQRILRTNDVITVGHCLRITFFAVYVAFAFSVYFLLRQYLPLLYAFLGALISILSLYTYLMSNQLAPEILFGLTTTLFFICDKRASRPAHDVVSFVFATASYALRTIGVALFVAWIGAALLERRFKCVFLRLALSLIPIIGWQSYIHRVESSHDYKSPAYEYQRADYLFYNVSYAKNIFTQKDSFSPESGPATIKDIVGRFVANLTRLPSSIGQAFTSERKCWLVPFSRSHPAETGFVLDLSLMVLGCLILVGLGLQLARRQWIIPLYVLASTAVICLTPWPIQLVRYLTPLCPLFAVAFFTALLYLESVSQKASSKLARPVTSFLIASGVSLLLLHQLVVFYRFTKYVDTIVYDLPDGREARLHVFGYFPLERAINDGSSWLMKRARPNEVVATYAPQWVYLRTGLKAVMPPFELNPERAQKLLDSVPVTYLIFEQSFTKRYVSLVIQRYPNIWKEIYSDQDGAFKIYERASDISKFQSRRVLAPLIATQRRSSFGLVGSSAASR